jgi:5'(3')-deoxyribonucleotidase
MYLTISIDMDNTLNDLSLFFFHYIDKLGYPYDLSKYTSYKIEDVLLVPEEEKKAIKEEIFQIKDFWLKIYMKWLYENYNIQIITMPYKNTNFYKDVKIEWMLKNFPYFNEEAILFKHDKWTIPMDIIIDDNVEIIKNCYNKGIVTIVPSHQYNLNLKEANYYFSSWNEIKSIVKGI